MPRQICVEAHVQCVSLIVVHGGKAGRNIERTCRCYRHGADQAAGDGRGGLGDLIGIGEMKLAAMPEVGRAQREFPALNPGIIPGDGPEEIRFSNVVVVEPIMSPGCIIVGTEIPSVVRDGDAELPFDIALTVQRRETKILAGGQIEQRAGSGHEWRGLVVETVETAKDPIQARHSHGNANPRIGCVLGDRGQRRWGGGIELGFSQACDEGQPRGYFELIVDKFGDNTSVYANGRGWVVVVVRPFGGSPYGVQF